MAAKKKVPASRTKNTAKPATARTRRKPQATRRPTAKNNPAQEDLLAHKLGDRYNAGKPQLTFLLEMPNACIGLSRVGTFGASKYARNNYQDGLPATEVVDSLMRHLLAYVSGEDIDPETGLRHTAHLAWNAMVLSEFDSNELKAVTDNRSSKLKINKE